MAEKTLYHLPILSPTTCQRYSTLWFILNQLHAIIPSTPLYTCMFSSHYGMPFPLLPIFISMANSYSFLKTWITYLGRAELPFPSLSQEWLNLLQYPAFCNQLPHWLSLSSVSKEFCFVNLLVPKTSGSVWHTVGTQYMTIMWIGMPSPLYF